MSSALLPFDDDDELAQATTINNSTYSVSRSLLSAPVSPDGIINFQPFYPITPKMLSESSSGLGRQPQSSNPVSAISSAKRDRRTEEWSGPVSYHALLALRAVLDRIELHNGIINGLADLAPEAVSFKPYVHSIVYRISIQPLRYNLCSDFVIQKHQFRPWLK